MNQAAESPESIYAADTEDSAAWKKYQAAVNAELVKLEQLGRGQIYQKRRNTVWAIAWAEVTGHIPLDQVFARSDTVSKGIYYHKQKGWYHNKIFAAVLEAVTKLTRDFVEGKRGRELERSQAEWQRKMIAITDNGYSKLSTMLDFPLTEIELVEEEERDLAGNVVKIFKQVIRPAGWNYGNVPGLLREIDRAGRLARQMNTDKSEVTGEGGEPIPVGITYIVENRNVPVPDEE